MQQILTFFGPWTWFIIAIALLLLELLVSGVFILWFGIAALAVGIIDLIIPMSWQWEMSIFAVLSIVMVLVARPIIMARITDTSEQPNLNERNRQFIGKRYMLTDPIINGKGTLNISDTRWRITGKDMDANQWVRVTGTDGMTLLVEPDEG